MVNLKNQAKNQDLLALMLT